MHHLKKRKKKRKTNNFFVNEKSYICAGESCLLSALSAALSKVLISSRCCISTELMPPDSLCFSVFLPSRSVTILYTWMFPMERGGGDIRFDQGPETSVGCCFRHRSEPNRPMVKLLGRVFFFFF